MEASYKFAELVGGFFFIKYIVMRCKLFYNGEIKAWVSMFISLYSLIVTDIN